MFLQDGRIPGTAKTPEISLNTEGIIRIKGHWILENNAPFSKVMSDWYDKFIFDLTDISAIDIHLEYFSSNNIFILTSLLRRILCISVLHRNFPINWYYEQGDEDILDLGESISTILGKPFNFIMAQNNKTTVGYSKLQA
jgi:hypothetical protein